MHKVDLFVSTLDLTPNRVLWSRQTLNFYLKEPGLRITILDAGSKPEQLEWFRNQQLIVVPQPYEGSVHRRFLLAEALAQSEFFLVSDNDILPVSENWLTVGLETMRRHPGFGWICYRLENTDFASDGQFNDSEVRSVKWGGGLAIIKRDARQYPFGVPFIFNPNSADDREYCNAIQKSGHMTGQFLQQYVRHLGQSESSAWGRSDNLVYGDRTQ